MRIYISLMIIVLTAGCRLLAPDEGSDIKGGFTVDNSGDTVLCRPDPDLQAEGGTYFEGEYTFDYLTTASATTADEPQLNSWAAYQARMSALLADKLPDARASFDDFSSLLESTDPTKHLIWQPSALKLVDLQDIEMEQVAPKNCLSANSRDMEIRQVVRRKDPTASSDKLYFLYHQESFTNLRERRPLQFSFLVTHEWLWNLSRDPWVIRTVNRLLHSESIRNLTVEQFRAYLEDVGITVGESGRLIRVGAKDTELKELFSSRPQCDYKQRVVKDFLFPAMGLQLAPGETRTFEIDLAPGTNLDAKICGVGLLFHYQYATPEAQTLQVSIKYKGSIPVEKAISTATKPEGQELYFGVCKETSLCALKEGDLGALLYGSSTPTGKWKITVKNPSPFQKLDIHRAALTFVKAGP